MKEYLFEPHKMLYANGNKQKQILYTKYWNDVYLYTVKIMEIIPKYYYFLQLIGICCFMIQNNMLIALVTKIQYK